MTRKPFKSEDELEQFVFANLNQYFSENRIMIQSRKKIKTKNEQGTIPDGLLIDFDDQCLIFIENELLGHGVFPHIAPQLIRFIVAFQNPETKDKLRDWFISEIQQNPENLDLLNLEKTALVGIDVVHLFEKIINSSPKFYVFIDSINDDLKDLCLALAKTVKIQIVEVMKFQNGNAISYEFNKVRSDDEIDESIGTTDDIHDDSTEIDEKNQKTFTPLQQKYFDFFSHLKTNWVKSHPDAVEPYFKPKPSGYMDIASGISGITYSWAFWKRKAFTVIYSILGYNSARNKAILENLQTHKDKIEQELGSLEWYTIQGKEIREDNIRIILSYPKDITTIMELSDEQLKILHDWGLESMTKVMTTFQPYMEVDF